MSGFLVNSYRFAVAIAAYLLRTDFSGVSGQPVTLTNGQVLDTEAEGMLDGSLTIVDVEGGLATLSDDQLIFTAQSSPIFGDLGCSIGEITLQEGLVIESDVTVDYDTSASTSGYVIGFINQAALQGSAIIGGFFVQGGIGIRKILWVLYNTAGSVELETLVDDNTARKFHVVFDPTNNLLFAYIDNVLRIVETCSDTSVFPVITNRSQTAVKVNGVKIPETLYPELVTPIIHDAFGGAVDTDIAGRTPDTVDNGNSWIKTNSTGDTIGVDGSGTAQFVQSDSTVGIYSLESDNSDVYALASVESLTVGTASDLGVRARLDVTAAQYVDEIAAVVENDTNLLKITEYVSGTPTTVSVAYNPPESSAYNLSLNVSGTTATAIAGITVLSATVTSSTETGVGLILIGVSGYSQRTYCHDFKVYKASGVTIDV